MAEAVDIAVIGAGVAGIAAACGAAQNGASVLLIDKNDRIGGLGTNAEVGTICGLYTYGKDGYELNVGQFAATFADRIGVLSKSVPEQDGTGLKFLPYNTESFEQVCCEMIASPQITYLPSTRLMNVNKQGRNTTEIRITNADGEQLIPVKAIVDTSGVSIASDLLGLAIKEPDFDQVTTQVFKIEGIAFEQEQQVFLVMRRALCNAILNGHLPKGSDEVYLVPGSFKENTMMFKLNLNDQAQNIRERVQEIASFLIENVMSFRNAKLLSMANTSSKRIAGRPYGRMMLSSSDVLSCAKSEDGIAKGNWPQEIWKSGEPLKLVPLRSHDYYDIPADCLISREIDNLFFGGRCISADDEAIASARVMGTCLQTGFAAGYMAAKKIENVELRTSITELQRTQFGHG